MNTNLNIETHQESDQNEEVFVPRPCIVINPNISFDLESEDEQLPEKKQNTKHQRSAKTSKEQLQVPLEIRSDRQIFFDSLNELFEKCGMEEKEISQATSDNLFVEVGHVVNITQNCFLVQPKTDILMDLENLLFVEFPEQLHSFYQNEGAILSETNQIHRKFFLLGEIEDVFGKLESPFYKLKESKMLRLLRANIAKNTKIYAIENKISKITEKDIYRMKLEKKSDASGQFDQEIDQGYLPVQSNRSEEERDFQKRKKDKRDQPFTNQSDLNMLMNINMFGAGSAKSKHTKPGFGANQGHMMSGYVGQKEKKFRSKRVKSDVKNNRAFSQATTPNVSEFQLNYQHANILPNPNMPAMYANNYQMYNPQSNILQRNLPPQMNTSMTPSHMPNMGLNINNNMMPMNPAMTPMNMPFYYNNINPENLKNLNIPYQPSPNFYTQYQNNLQMPPTNQQNPNEKKS